MSSEGKLSQNPGGVWLADFEILALLEFDKNIHLGTSMLAQYVEEFRQSISNQIQEILMQGHRAVSLNIQTSANN